MMTNKEGWSADLAASSLRSCAAVFLAIAADSRACCLLSTSFFLGCLPGLVIWTDAVVFDFSGFGLFFLFFPVILAVTNSFLLTQRSTVGVAPGTIAVSPLFSSCFRIDLPARAAAGLDWIHLSW